MGVGRGGSNLKERLQKSRSPQFKKFQKKELSEGRKYLLDTGIPQVTLNCVSFRYTYV